MPGSTTARMVIGLAAAAFVVGGLFGGAMAQQGSPPGAVGAIDTIGSAEPTMSGSQQVAWVGEQLGIARSIRRQVENMLDQARKEKDTLKITCIDDKLTQLIVSIKGMEERQGSLQAAVQGKDTSSANQHFTILKIYASRVQGLKAEAESCIGDSDVVLGESETIVEVDENITMEDPSEGGPDVDVWVEQPPQASGFY